MPVTRHLRALAILPIIAFLPRSGAEGAEVTEGSYISIDDYVLMDAGLIIPIVEYVDIERSFLGDRKFETGYLHIYGHPEAMVDNLLADYRLADGAMTDYGVLDLANARRVTLAGSLDVDGDSLSWRPSLFSPTSHEPGRSSVSGDNAYRVSPFVAATEHAAGNRASVDIVTFDDQTLSVRDSAGNVHSYARADLGTTRMVGLLAAMAQASIARTRECLWPIAEALITTQDYPYSADAIAELGASLGSDTEAAAMLAEIRTRGFGHLLWRLADAESRAWWHMGTYLQAKVDRAGGLVAFAQTLEPFEPALDFEDGLAPILIERFHIFDFDYIDGEPPFTDMGEAMDALEAAYAADPFALTAPMMMATDRYGWVSLIGLLLNFEMEINCDAAEW